MAEHDLGLEERLAPYRSGKEAIGPFCRKHEHIAVFHRGKRPKGMDFDGVTTTCISMERGEDFYRGMRVHGVILAASGPFTDKETRFLAENAWPLVGQAKDNELLWVPT